MNKLVKLFLDLIFPKKCLGCGASNSWLCQICWGRLQSDLTEYSHLQIEKRIPYCDQVLVVSVYANSLLAEMLHFFKYHYVEGVAWYLSKLSINFLKSFQQEKFDFVVPVPLSKKRKLERGFNQSEIIAQAVSQEFSWQLDTKTLIRSQHARPQVGLSAEQRLTNVKDIFSLTNQNNFKNKKILLVDDVVTTGATMQECAKLLKKAGASRVVAFAILNS